MKKGIKDINQTPEASRHIFTEIIRNGARSLLHKAFDVEVQQRFKTSCSQLLRINLKVCAHHVKFSDSQIVETSLKMLQHSLIFASE